MQTYTARKIILSENINYKYFEEKETGKIALINRSRPSLYLVEETSIQKLPPKVSDSKEKEIIMFSHYFQNAHIQK